MAKLKFDLKIGDIRVRSIQDLQDNFDEDEVLQNYKNNTTLIRWLDAWGFNDYLEKVKSIESTEDDQIIKELADIFEVELSNKSDFEKLLDKANKLFEKDLFEDALSKLENALLLAPNNDEVLQKIDACKEELLQVVSPKSKTTQAIQKEAYNQVKSQLEEDICVKYLKYEVYFDDNEQSSGIMITGIDNEYFYSITEEDKYGKLNIPSKIKGFPVYAIKTTDDNNGSFINCRMLIEITIPDGVTYISNNAFSGCFSLKEVTIPDSITSFGKNAFSGCFSLKEVNIPDSVTYIGENAFSGCFSLKKITIPDSITSFSWEYFSNYGNLTKITIPDGFTSIGDSAFSRCSSLTSVIIPDSVTSIGHYAFYNCSSLTSVNIPDSVTSIGEHAFNGCSRLKISAPNHLRGHLSQYSNITTTYRD